MPNDLDATDTAPPTGRAHRDDHRRDGAGYTRSALLESPDQARRDALREQIIVDLTSALVPVGRSAHRFGVR